MLQISLPHRLATFAIRILISSVTANAEVLDQSFTREEFNYNLNANVGLGFAYVAQTVTPGMSGQLTRAELNIYRQPSSNQNWEISVRRVVDEYPTGQILATELLSASQIPVVSQSPLPLANVVFEPAPDIEVGVSFALVVRLEGTSGSPGLSVGGWIGHAITDAYPSGRHTFSGDGSTFSFSQPEDDLFFRSFVQPVPEPATTTIAVIGVGALICRLRARPFKGSRRHRSLRDTECFD